MNKLIIFLSILAIASCKKENNDEHIESQHTPHYVGSITSESTTIINDFIEFYDSYYDAEIKITDLHQFGSIDGQNAGVKFRNINTSYTEFTINGILYDDFTSTTVIGTNDPTLTSVFGDDLVVEIDPDTTFTIYSPERFNVESEDGHLVSIGSEFTWEPDPNSTKGVFVHLRFDPVGNMKPVPASATLQNYFTHTEDDGSYSLESGLFDNIPDSVFVYVYFMRGNWELVTPNTKTIGITILSEAGGPLLYE